MVALIGAAVAGFGALLAMVGAVFAAFFATLAAELGAYPADITGVLAILGHERRGQAAELGALHIQANTFAHDVDVIFLEAGNRATITVDRTDVACFDTCFEFVKVHSRLLASRSDDVCRSGREYIFLYSGVATTPKRDKAHAVYIAGNFGYEGFIVKSILSYRYIFFFEHTKSIH